MIELKNVCAGYGSSTVIKDVSVSFGKGELTAVTGVNGCGKSTLLKAVLGMLPLKSGEISVDTDRTDSMTRKAAAKKMAYLAQGKSTPDMTVAQLVLHGRFPHLNYPRRYSRQDRETAWAAMEKMGIADLADSQLQYLSGGMRQNAYIAMALAQETDYILLDEPTTYLDISHQLGLMKTLRALADSGKGIITVMHDLPIAFTFSDKIVVLNEGRIAGCGSPENICAQNITEKIFGAGIEKSADTGSYIYKY